MTEKIAIRTTTYEIQDCGDGCCLWSNTKIESDDGRIDWDKDYHMFYSVDDLINWLNDYFYEYGKPQDWWQEVYYIDEKNSSFY